MSRCWLILLLSFASFGCAARLPNMQPGPLANPTLIPLTDVDYVWDGVVDVVDNYFRIEMEIRVKLIGNTFTEGRIDTYPEPSATLLEPWRRDTVTGYDRLEATFQTIRRRGLIRVIPSQEGFLVDVAVFKEMEDLPQPEKATAGAATFRNDSSLSRFNEPVGGQSLTFGWIPIGRDPNLEQKIICKLQARFGQNVGWPFPFIQTSDEPVDAAPSAYGGAEVIPAPNAEPPTRMIPLPAP